MKALIFDLDGTLIDSKHGICKGIEYALSEKGLNEEEIAGFIALIDNYLGLRIHEIIRKIPKNFDSYTIDHIVSKFRYYYDTIGWQQFELYEGIIELLEWTKLSGFSNFIATNKPKNPTRLIMQISGLDHYFEDVFSPDSIVGAELTKFEIVKFIINKYRLPFHNVWMIGDQKSDVDAGIGNKLRCIFAAYGYGNTKIVTEYFDNEVAIANDAISICSILLKEADHGSWDENI